MAGTLKESVKKIDPTLSIHEIEAASIVQEMATIAERARKQFDDTHQALQQLRSAQSFAGIGIAIAQQWSAMAESVRQALVHRDKVLERVDVLGLLGWTVPMQSTMTELDTLLAQSTSIEAADAAFTKYYMARDGAHLKQLNKELLSRTDLETWWPVIEEAILDFKDFRYRSCIALLLPLIEGVTALKFSTTRFHDARKRTKFFDDKLLAAKGSMERAVWSSLKAFAEVLFKRIDFDDRTARPSFLNRHWLLHGRGPWDANLSDCLRLLQALDTITQLD
jgi:hypothetical protein